MSAVPTRFSVRAADHALEASFTAGAQTAAGAVIGPPHPLYGGTLSNPVVAAAREGFAQVGCASLSFNFRGTEASEGVATDDLDAAVADYRACLDELATRVAGPIFAAGYSFGGGTALLSALEDPRVKGVVLLAPPLGMLRAEDLARFPGALLVVVGDNDEYAPMRQLEGVLSARTDLALEVIPGADHFFHFGGLWEISGRIASHVRTWL
jgi:alpha/beta superfamily hydrolase